MKLVGKRDSASLNGFDMVKSLKMKWFVGFSNKDFIQFRHGNLSSNFLLLASVNISPHNFDRNLDSCV